MISLHLNVKSRRSFSGSAKYFQFGCYLLEKRHDLSPPSIILLHQRMTKTTEGNSINEHRNLNRRYEMKNSISHCRSPSEPSTVIYKCQSCDYSELSITHTIGWIIDWIRDRENRSSCPKCGGKLERRTLPPPPTPPWVIY